MVTGCIEIFHLAFKYSIVKVILSYITFMQIIQTGIWKLLFSVCHRVQLTHGLPHCTPSTIFPFLSCQRHIKQPLSIITSKSIFMAERKIMEISLIYVFLLVNQNRLYIRPVKIKFSWSSSLPSTCIQIIQHHDAILLLLWAASASEHLSQRNNLTSWQATSQPTS